MQLGRLKKERNSYTGATSASPGSRAAANPRLTSRGRLLPVLESYRKWALAHGGGTWSPGNGLGDWPDRLQPRPMVRRLANARRRDRGCAGDSNRQRCSLASSVGLPPALVLSPWITRKMSFSECPPGGVGARRGRDPRLRAPRGLGQLGLWPAAPGPPARTCLRSPAGPAPRGLGCGPLPSHRVAGGPRRDPGVSGSAATPTVRGHCGNSRGPRRSIRWPRAPLWEENVQSSKPRLRDSSHSFKHSTTEKLQQPPAP